MAKKEGIADVSQHLRLLHGHVVSLSVSTIVIALHHEFHTAESCRSLTYV
jgi:hypothetical protein